MNHVTPVHDSLGMPAWLVKAKNPRSLRALPAYARVEVMPGIYSVPIEWTDIITHFFAGMCKECVSKACNVWNWDELKDADITPRDRRDTRRRRNEKQTFTAPQGKVDHLQVLGLKDPFTAEELRSAYRKAAFTHHPDRGGDVNVMVQVNAAYEHLRGRMN